MKSVNIGEGHHKCVLDVAIVGSIFNFLREDVAEVDDTKDVFGGDFVQTRKFTDFGLPEVDAFGALVCE